MEILVAILIIALIAVIAYAVLSRRPGGAGGLGRPGSSPLPRRDRTAARRDPMAAAVADHAEANDPADAIVAEQRLQAQAREVAAGLNAEAYRSEHQRAAGQVGDDPAYANGPASTGAYADPAPAPTYGDPRSDDYVDPHEDDRRR